MSIGFRNLRKGLHVKSLKELGNNRFTVVRVLLFLLEMRMYEESKQRGTERDDVNRNKTGDSKERLTYVTKRLLRRAKVEVERG